MKDPLSWLLALQLLTTLPLVGLIWTIQIVHYPLFSRVAETGFVRYQEAHMRAIGPLVGPLMLVEALVALGLVIMRPDALSVAGLALLVVIWASTAFIQVPCHRVLTERFDDHAHRRLVSSNWIRTVAWTLRGIIALFMIPLLTGS